MVAFGVATFASILWSFRVFKGWADAVFVFPMAAAGLGGLVLLLARRLPSAATVAAVATFAVVGLVASGATSATTRQDNLEPLRDVTEELLATAGPGPDRDT